MLALKRTFFIRAI